MLNIGHRGAMGHAPENTLASFQLALDMNVDWLELDVYFVDGELVVIHDDTLERTTNGQGDVMAQSLDYLRRLDAGNGEKIPLLSEVFELVDKRVGINVELKGPNTAKATVKFLECQLEKGWQVEQLLLSSFDHQELLLAKQTNPLFPRAPLFWDNPIDYDFVLNEIEGIAINPSLRIVTPEMIEEAHQNQLKVFVYTVNEIKELQNMIDWGADGVFTNFPDRLPKVNPEK